MELKLGTGKNENTKIIELKGKGIAQTNILKECWNKACKGNDSCFNLLCQMLQVFCLIIPISMINFLPSAKSLEPSALDHHNAALPEEAMYLIPSMLPKKSVPVENLAMYGLTFWFDFQGFLPVEVYHRLLCLMLRDRRADLSEIFSAKFFQVYEVSDRNWMVQIVECKLKISVTYANRYDVLWSSNIAILHTAILLLIRISYSTLRRAYKPQHPD